MYLGNLF